MTLRDHLETVLSGTDLTTDQSADCVREIVGGEAAPEIVAGLLVALRAKGESPEEVAGFADAMRSRAVPVRPKVTGLVDTCGTGGDGKATINISTAAAFVVAGAGLPVAKHGNAALSSRSGSADVLQALGVKLDVTAEQVADCIDEAGIGFIFAPRFHPAMAAVMPVRRALGIRTIFNVLGPLTNPAVPSFQLVGVGDHSLQDLVAGALARLDRDRVVVVHGNGGTDELTLQGPSRALVVESGGISELTVDPAALGLDEAPIQALAGADPASNAQALRRVLDGENGPHRDVIVLNAAAALFAARRATSVADGLEPARESIDSGRAAVALERLVAKTAAAGA